MPGRGGGTVHAGSRVAWPTRPAEGDQERDVRVLSPLNTILPFVRNRIDPKWVIGVVGLRVFVFRERFVFATLTVQTERESSMRWSSIQLCPQATIHTPLQLSFSLDSLFLFLFFIFSIHCSTHAFSLLSSTPPLDSSPSLRTNLLPPSPPPRRHNKGTQSRSPKITAPEFLCSTDRLPHRVHAPTPILFNNSTSNHHHFHLILHLVRGRRVYSRLLDSWHSTTHPLILGL